MTLNTSDRKSVRAAEKAAAVADRERGETIIQLMSTSPGRRLVWDKLGSAGIFTTTFSTDALQMAFNEGQRNQGLLLLNDIIQWCPEQFIQSMREHNERSTSTGRDSRDTADAEAGSVGERSDGEDSDGGDQGPSSEAA